MQTQDNYYKNKSKSIQHSLKHGDTPASLHKKTVTRTLPFLMPSFSHISPLSVIPFLPISPNLLVGTRQINLLTPWHESPEKSS